MSNLLFKSGDDWTFELLDQAWEEIKIIAEEDMDLKLGVDYFKPEIQVVSAEQMLDAYSAIGMPIYYKHWSFGKEFIKNEKYYKQGVMGLAYEMVINSNPCIAYLMEENDMMMQTLVMAHASVGHSAVFKSNYCFKDNTNPDSILDYLTFAKNYLKKCEEKYGEYEVEIMLDSCHAISEYGIDKYKRIKKQSVKNEEQHALDKFEQELKDYNPTWEKLIKKKAQIEGSLLNFPKEPEDNILYFIEKNAPLLPQWKREIIRIVRKISQYFSPQGGTKTLNEGFASFTHHYIMGRMYDKGFIDEGTYMSFIRSHVSVLKQFNYDSKHFSGFNPYALGFAIFTDIKRICENPTDEDKKFFPDMAGTNWISAVKYAMANFKDDSFILQYLSPKVARDFRMFHLEDRSENEFYSVDNIHNESGFHELRYRLSKNYDRSSYVPNIQVTGVDLSGNRTLTLKHKSIDGISLSDSTAQTTLDHVAELWEFPVELISNEKTIKSFGRYSDLEEEEEEEEEKLIVTSDLFY